MECIDALNNIVGAAVVKNGLALCLTLPVVLDSATWTPPKSMGSPVHSLTQSDLVGNSDETKPDVSAVWFISGRFYSRTRHRCLVEPGGAKCLAREGVWTLVTDRAVTP